MRAAILAFALTLPAAAQTADYGAVHGTVLTIDDAPLPGGEVQLTSREEDFSAKVGPDGKFALHARPGIYSLKVIRPGIIPFQRAQIVVRAGSVVNLNVRPVFDNPDPGVHYYSFAVPGAIELGAVLRRVDHGPDDMMLSFDSLSVYARNIECFPRTLHCTATGDARIEIGQDDGVHRDRAPRIEIDLPQRAAALYGDESPRELKF
jgi:hypothetical protein